MPSNIPKLGLALSGAAARSSFYVGFLEVLLEQNIKIDYIVAQSGATVAAASLACGSLESLKTLLFSLNRKQVMSLLRVKNNDDERGGLFSLDKVEEIIREEITKGKRFEDVMPRLVFVATDLTTGEPVRLEMGDIAKGIRCSCTVPGLFHPFPWGKQVLVDGGLVSFIPGEFARQSGANVVVGVNVRATQHIFPRGWLNFRSWYNWIKKLLALHYLNGLWKNGNNKLSGNSSLDFLEPLTVGNAKLVPGSLGVLGRSLDIALEASKKTRLQDQKFGCDLLIREGARDFGGSVRLNDMRRLYRDGRIAAEKALPEIKKLLEVDENVGLR